MVRISWNNVNRFDKDDFRDFRDRPARFGRRRRRGWRWKFGCCLFIIILLVTFGLVATAMLAKTGLIYIPVFSDIFYKPPTAVRQVSASQADSGVVAQKLQAWTTTNSLTLTEAELTWLFKQALTGSADSYFAPGVQVVITDSYIDFFGRLQKPTSANITLTLKPSLDQGKIKLELLAAQLGSLSMPPAMATWLLSEVFGKNMQAALDQLNSGAIENLELENGKIILTLAN